MAQVFVSYRRADGVYAVGWLAERLRELDEITGVQSTFHDSVLRPGVDLMDALDDELRSCSVVIAVITPEWRGQRPDGSVRIMDPDDWIVRELAGALEHDKLIVPILVDGAEHPLPSQMHASIGGISSLLARPFRDGADLDQIMDHVRAHVADVEAEKARLAGLEAPVTVPKLPRPWTIVAVATVLGLVLGTLLWWSSSVGIEADGSGCSDDTVCVQRTGWYRALEFWMIGFGLFAGALAAAGGALAVRLLRIARIDGRAIAMTTVGMGGTLLLITIASGSGHAALADVPGLPNPWLRFAANAFVAGVGASGLIVCLFAPIYATPRAPSHLLGERVAYLAILRDAERWATGFLSALFAVVTGAGAMLMAAFDASDVDLDTSSLPNIVFALVFSMMLLIVHRWASTRLSDEYAAVDRELRRLAPQYRANAEPRLQARSFDEGGWAFRALGALPLVVALAAAALTTVG